MSNKTHISIVFMGKHFEAALENADTEQYKNILHHVDTVMKSMQVTDYLVGHGQQNTLIAGFQNQFRDVCKRIPTDGIQTNLGFAEIKHDPLQYQSHCTINVNLLELATIS